MCAHYCFLFREDILSCCVYNCKNSFTISKFFFELVGSADIYRIVCMLSHNTAVLSEKTATICEKKVLPVLPLANVEYSIVNAAHSLQPLGIILSQ